MQLSSYVLVTLCLIGIAFTPPIKAATSGLNNIPTADTAPHRTLVIQEFSTAGARRRPDHVAGFKFGVDPWETGKWRHRFEWGIDGHFAPGDAGPAVLQAKYAMQPNRLWPALSVGVANLAATSSDRARAGQPFSYAILSYDLKVTRLHGGYALQAGNNNTALLGIDKTVKFIGRDLMLRADAVQIDHRSNWAASAGGVYGIGKYFAVEAWMTQSTQGRPPSFTIKLDLIFKL